jgi:hypothetical protein
MTTPLDDCLDPAAAIETLLFIRRRYAELGRALSFRESDANGASVLRLASAGLVVVSRTHDGCAYVTPAAVRKHTRTQENNHGQKDRHQP